MLLYTPVAEMGEIRLIALELKGMRERCVLQETEVWDEGMCGVAFKREQEGIGNRSRWRECEHRKRRQM